MLLNAELIADCTVLVLHMFEDHLSFSRRIAFLLQGLTEHAPGDLFFRQRLFAAQFSAVVAVAVVGESVSDIHNAVSLFAIAVWILASMEAEHKQEGTMKDGELLLRVEDAATELGLSRAKTYELVMSGRIRSIKIDRSRRAVSYTHLRAHETDSYLVCR